MFFTRSKTAVVLIMVLTALSLGGLAVQGLAEGADPSARVGGNGQATKEQDPAKLQQENERLRKDLAAALQQLLAAQDQIARLQKELKIRQEQAAAADKQADALKRAAEQAFRQAEEELRRAREAELRARETAEKARQQAEEARRQEAVQKIRQNADRAISSNNLKQIALAMHIHADTHKTVPAAASSKDGKPLLSWRVAILPYIEENDLYKQFKLDEPWDSDHNKKLLEKMPKIYAPVGVKTKDKHSTFYQVFTGKGTMFDGDQGIRFAQVTDGLSNTIMVIEAGTPVPWTKPDDLPYDAKKPLPKLGGLFDGGFHIALGDGSVRFVRPNFNERILRLAITRDDGEAIDLDKLNAK
jgi:hypothetical protein